MKKNFIGIFAATLAIAFVAFSAFTKHEFRLAKKDAPSKYLTYDVEIAGAQNSLSSYTTSLQNAPTTAPSACNNNVSLCWFRVDDMDHDNDIDTDDFNASFEAIDVNNDGSNSLDDESEISGQFEKQL